MSENDEVAGAMDRMAQELYQDIKQVSLAHDQSLESMLPMVLDLLDQIIYGVIKG